MSDEMHRTLLAFRHHLGPERFRAILDTVRPAGQPAPHTCSRCQRLVGYDEPTTCARCLPNPGLLAFGERVREACAKSIDDFTTKTINGKGPHDIVRAVDVARLLEET